MLHQRYGDVSLGIPVTQLPRVGSMLLKGLQQADRLDNRLALPFDSDIRLDGAPQIDDPGPDHRKHVALVEQAKVHHVRQILVVVRHIQDCRLGVFGEAEYAMIRRVIGCELVHHIVEVRVK